MTPARRPPVRRRDLLLEGLLDLHRSGNRNAIAVCDECMFKLYLRIELEAIVEAVREEDDEAMKVQDGAEAVVLGLHHV